MATLLEDLRDHLVAHGIVRRPRETLPAGRPPMWLEPRNGIPAPGEGQNATEVGSDAVVGAYVSGGIATDRHEGFLRIDGIDIHLRTRTAPIALELEAQIRAALNDRRHWTMGSRTVEESLQFRPLQRLGSGDHGFDWVTEYLFWQLVS